MTEMQTKIKVSREVADAIEFQLTRRSTEDLLTAVVKHKNFGGSFVLRSKVLNGLSIAETARILYVGYEVEETPEEKVALYYNELKRIEDNCESHGCSGSQFRQGWQSVEHTLNLLGLKIEGVNA